MIFSDVAPVPLSKPTSPSLLNDTLSSAGNVMKTRRLPVSRPASRSFADSIRCLICEHIERAPDRIGAHSQNVGADHRCLDVRMTEELLHCSNVRAGLQQVRHERVP